MIINKPLKFTHEYEIADCFGSIVIPSIVWSGDIGHKNKQKELGELIVKLLNEYEEKGNELKEEPKTLIETLVKRGRGRPRKT